MKKSIKSITAVIVLMIAVLGITFSLIFYRSANLHGAVTATLTTLDEITAQYLHNFETTFAAEK